MPVGVEPAATRRELQRLAVHLLARRRHAATGRFGLRATPGGFGTPAFGPSESVEVVRVSGTDLVHEQGLSVGTAPISGASLASLATWLGVDLAAPLSVGHDTPELGDVDAPIHLDPAVAERIADWFALGWRAVDVVAATDHGGATLQLWPEHFDAGTSVPVGSGPDARANVGASAGDGFHEEPYLYVGPWGSERPGGAAFWNAPFGAVLAAQDVASLDDAVAFLQRGLDLLRG